MVHLHVVGADDEDVAHFDRSGRDFLILELLPQQFLEVISDNPPLLFAFLRAT